MRQINYCTVCKSHEVRLYRYYGNALRANEIFCKAHAPEGAREYLTPLVEDVDGSVWGYTSAPEDAIARWNALPEGEGDQ